MTGRWFLSFIGVFFGFCLSQIGFSSWDEVHRMFTFTDVRLVATFLSAVLLLGTVYRLTRTRIGPGTPRRVHPGTFAGGVVFGVGWAVSGACPAIALVQIGEGQLGALATLLGIFLGNWLYALIHERHFRWTTTSCMDQ